MKSVFASHFENPFSIWEQRFSCNNQIGACLKAEYAILSILMLKFKRFKILHNL